MAELALKARAPLAHCAVPMRLGPQDDAPGVVLRAVDDLALTLVVARQGREAAMREAAAAAGVVLPMQPGASFSDAVWLIWSGPDQWLAAAEPRGQADADRLLQRLAAEGMTLDQSDARTVVAVAGPRARLCLAKGFPIDLHPRSFGPGDAALTFAAGVSALIWQVDDAPSYRIAVPRSSGESFWHWLTEAAAEYGCEVTA